MPARLSDILKRTPPISADISVRAVFNNFLSDPDLTAIVVVDANKPIGVVTRRHLAEQLASPNGLSVLAAKPISCATIKGAASTKGT